MLHACNMCCFTFRSPELLAQHIIKRHKHDPQFLVNCKRCLRSYTKWDSYRKHIQRGCTDVSIPCGTSAVLCDSGDENIEDFCENEGSFEQPPDSEACQRWHEAAFILKVKEQYVVSQAVIDHLLPATKELVSNILSGVLSKIQDQIPIDSLKLLEDEIKHANTTLFHGLESAFLQKTFFRDEFNLVVSYNTVRHINCFKLEHYILYLKLYSNFQLSDHSAVGFM